MKQFSLYIFLLILISSCNKPAPVFNLSFLESTKICTNCQSPNIFSINTEKQLITYIQQNEDNTDALIFHTYKNGILSDPTEIARGANWFVNWADIPSIVSLDTQGQKLMAHWLQMSASGTYDYDIKCSISRNAGKTWEEPFTLHDDNIAAEHGFVTMTSTKEGAMVTWLDGRNTKTPDGKTKDSESHDTHDDHGHTGNLPMTLRAAFINPSGIKTKDLEIDNRVCDCCQTDAIHTKSGPVIVYRDRSENEIRDISVAKYIDGKWKTKKLHNDNWKISGCPVNGPAIDYKNGIVAVAWYTQLNDEPVVYLSVSNDDGETFLQPILVDIHKVMGRVDVVIDEESNILVTWMKNDEQKAEIRTKIFLTDGTSHEIKEKIRTVNERAVGFPIIENTTKGFIMARTKSEDGVLSVQLEKLITP